MNSPAHVLRLQTLLDTHEEIENCNRGLENGMYNLVQNMQFKNHNRIEDATIPS